MKTYSFFAALMLWVSTASFAQDAIEIPSQLQLADIKLKISDELKPRIAADVKLLTEHPKTFRATVDRADAYFTIVERILLEEGVPDDMKYVLLLESKLVSDLVSRSNAVGYWQFKKETGVEMGLRVDEEVDERLNIVASTRSAARYLKRHNQQFNNWTYAVLAYNTGASGAKPYINAEKFGAKELDLEVDAKAHAYIVRFLAHKIAYESVIHRNPSLPLEVREYPECENKTLDEIALATNVSLDEVKDYNKWVKGNKVPADKDYTIVLPIRNLEAPIFMALRNPPVPETDPNLKPYEETKFFGLIKVKTEVPAPTPVTVTQSDGTVKTEYISQLPLFFSWNGIKSIMARKGDNIDKLANLGDIEKEDFKYYNDLRSFDKIIAGQVYYLRKKHRKAQVPYHTVQPGETLWEISQRYGIAMKHLLNKNGLESASTALIPGRVLWMRHERPSYVAVEYKKVDVPPVFPRPVHDTTLSASSNKSNIILVKKLEAPIVDTADEPEEPIIPKAGFEATKLEPGQSLFALSKKLAINYDSLQTWNSGEISLESTIYYKKPVAIPAKTDSVKKVPVTTVKIVMDSIGPAVKFTTPTVTKTVVTTPIPSKPVEVDTKPATIPSNNVATPKAVKTHTVVAKETFYSISKKYGVSVANIQKWNNKTLLTLSIGEVLKVSE